MAVNVKRPVRKIGEMTAGLLDDERGSRHIPGLQFELPKPVKPPAGNITQVQGS